MPEPLTLATWNIGGGILDRSHQRGLSPFLDHHCAVLREQTPDVLCLQEAHHYPDGRESQSEFLGRRAGYPYAVSFPISRSHLADDACLALGLVSRFPIRDVGYRRFPNPGLAASGPDGASWRLHDKGYLVATLDLGDRSLGVVNAHCFPLHRFGASPTEPRFAPMWRMLTEDLLAMGGAGHAFAGLDANYRQIGELLPEAVRPDRYLTAFEDTPTTPAGTQRDHILYGHAMRLLSTMVAPTRSDHAYCQAKVLM